jgi:DMSO/TMAO reductase YedYZ molybdopterin-dependent catalytic subunit
MSRRELLGKAAAGTLLVAFGGGLYYLAQDDLTRKARAEKRADGRSRLPPGQRVIRALRPMGGEPGDVRPATFTLTVHGAVENPFTLSYAELLDLPQVEQAADVHCVTGWSVLDARWQGVQVSHLAELAKVKEGARHVIFEAAHGYTANVRLAEALAPNALVAHRLGGNVLTKQHGAPVRAVVPDLYFWKSAKWLTGIRFVDRDRPGYWEMRGYNNHADPWREERYG